MDARRAAAEVALKTGNCDAYRHHRTNLNWYESDIRRKARESNVSLSSADRLELRAYGLRLQSDLPRDCPPKTAVTVPDAGGTQFSLGFDYITTRLPQVQGGTRFDAGAGTEVGILKSDRYLMGEGVSFSGQTAVPGNFHDAYLYWSSVFSRVDGSTQGSVPIGGDNVAQTYIFPNPFTDVTGINAGATGQSVSIHSEGHQLDTVIGFLMPVTHFFLQRERAGISDGVRFNFGVGLRHRYFSTEHTIHQQSFAFPGVNSTINLMTDSHFIAPNFSLGAEVLPKGPAGTFFGVSGYVAPGVLITDAQAMQYSRCNVCVVAEQVVDIGRNFNSTDFAAVVGVDAKFGYQFNPFVKVEVKGGYQHMTQLRFIDPPITPAQGTVKLSEGTTSNAYVGVKATLQLFSTDGFEHPSPKQSSFSDIDSLRRNWEGSYISIY